MRIPDAPTLYLLPGLLCDQTVWELQIEQLDAQADIRIADFRLQDSISGMAEAVLRTAPERFSLAGHSMGGRVALEIVRQAPGRVARLALLDTGVHGARAGEAEARQVLVDLAWNEGMVALADRWLPPMVHPAFRAGPEYRRLKAMVEAMTPQIQARQIKALLERPDATALLNGIDCPVLVGVGRQDGWSPVEQHQAIAAAIKDARLVVFEDCGHMAPIEAGAAVTRALRDWLNSGDRETG